MNGSLNASDELKIPTTANDSAVKMNISSFCSNSIASDGSASNRDENGQGIYNSVGCGNEAYDNQIVAEKHMSWKEENKKVKLIHMQVW